MIKLSESDRFELGTVSIFLGLAFITFVPLLLKTVLIYVEPNFFRSVGGFFMLLAAIFYYYSPAYYKKQFFILGINLIIFSLFQSAIGTGLKKSDFAMAVTPALGAFLIIMSVYLDKYRK